MTPGPGPSALPFPCSAAPLPGSCSSCSCSPAAPAAARTGPWAPRATSPARFLPRGAQAALVVPDLGTLGEKLARFQNLKLANFVAQLQNASSAEAYVSAIMRQVGVDLRSRQAMEAAGIDPGRGAGAALLGGDQAFSVLGVKDEKALEETFAKLAQDRLGASERAEQKVPGGTLVTFSRSGAPQPSLGLLFTEGYALVGAGAMVSQLSSYATLPAEKSLVQEPLLTASLNAAARRARLLRLPPRWHRLPRPGRHHPVRHRDGLARRARGDAAHGHAVAGHPGLARRARAAAGAGSARLPPRGQLLRGALPGRPRAARRRVALPRRLARSPARCRRAASTSRARCSTS